MQRCCAPSSRFEFSGASEFYSMVTWDQMTTKSSGETIEQEEQEETTRKTESKKGRSWRKYRFREEEEIKRRPTRSDPRLGVHLQQVVFNEPNNSSTQYKSNSISGAQILQTGTMKLLHSIWILNPYLIKKYKYPTLNLIPNENMMALGLGSVFIFSNSLIDLDSYSNCILSLMVWVHWNIWLRLYERWPKDLSDSRLASTRCLGLGQRKRMKKVIQSMRLPLMLK